MKKFYYIFIAFSMAIILFALSPIESQAAGANQSLTFIFDNDNLRLGVTYNGQAVSQFTDDSIGSSIDFDFTVNFRFIIPNSSGSGNRPLYANGYAMAFVQLPLTFGAGSDSSNWSYDYEVTYSDSNESVLHNIPQIRAQNTNLQFYYYAYFDNYYLPTGSSTPCEATVNIHVHSYLTSNAVTPVLTIGQGTFTNNGYSMLLETNPNPSTGMARIISRAIEQAINNSTDIDLIYAMISDLYNINYTYLPSILSALQTNNYDLDLIYGRLILQYGMDSQFQQRVLSFLSSYGSLEAEHESSKAQVVKEEMESLGDALTVEAPTIGGQLDQLESMVAQADTESVFSWLSLSGTIGTILVLTLLFGLIGFVLHGDS